MIIDDNKLIIGSANINDRSLWGSRDSELAVYMDGEADGVVTVNGNSYEVNSTIHNFRSEIFMEHFGMTREEVRDPTSGRFWATAWNTAQYNTEFYERAFSVYPSNKFTDWKSLATRNKKFDKGVFDKFKKNVRGHAVIFQYLFLNDVNLLKASRQEVGLLLVPIKALY
jgi:phospholipase D1/2